MAAPASNIKAPVVKLALAKEGNILSIQRITRKCFLHKIWSVSRKSVNKVMCFYTLISGAQSPKNTSVWQHPKKKLKIDQQAYDIIGLKCWINFS